MSKLENTIQILEDALAQGRPLRIIIEFFLNDEGEPEVDYEVTESGEHDLIVVCLNIKLSEGKQQNKVAAIGG